MATEITQADEASASADRPDSFPLRIQGGMLEALGINMYSSIGKCLVEFVANAFDGDAKRIAITMPTEEIQQARAQLRASAKKEVVEGKRDPFKVLLTPLPNDIAIVIEDTGHGMSPEDIERKFLPINRKRRLDAEGNESNLLSESGERTVMGRKGLGKLAGFGAATKVVIRTKRKGETFATTFVMDDNTIRDAEDLGQVNIPATYEEGLDHAEHGTRITLTGLKSDAVRYSLDTISQTIAEAFFGIEPKDMEILINGEQLEPVVHEYEFIYPEGAGPTNLSNHDVAVEDVTTLPVRFMVGFRPRGQHLPTSKRGARIYCNGRLAAGPTLFSLPTGMHNFHSQSYMECIVRADELDRHGIDLVNTNRTQLREDNEIVSSLINFVEEAMRRALVAHARWKESNVDRHIQESPQARMAQQLAERLGGRARTSARKILRYLAVEHGPNSAEFQELAPLIVDTMNAGEVLIRLSELGHDPKSLQVIGNSLCELARIEKSDALKTYRGKRDGINALIELIDRGEHELWKKKGIEKELHDLLKREPWLIKPEYSRYLTSDERTGNVAADLAKHLGVDAFAPLEDPTRPDLTFLLSDSAAPHVLTIVELKSPSLPLKMEHLTQLKMYMSKLEMYAQNELHRSITVHGYLIGAMPDPKTTNDDERLLLHEIQKSGPNANWVVLGVRALLERAQASHLSVIEALESDLAAIDEGEEPGEFYEQRALGGPGVRTVAGSSGAAAPLLIEARKEAAE
jgi:hypothetical protein